MTTPGSSGAAEPTAIERAAELTSVFASESAFRAFYDQALPKVYGYLVNRCAGDHSLAEELTQQAFASAIRERHRFDGRSDPIIWVVGIARHKLVDHFRARDRDERRHLQLIVREIQVDSSAAAWRSLDEREAINRALASLPTLQRAVLILHYADGLPVREMA